MDSDCGCKEKTWPEEEDETGDGFIDKMSKKNTKQKLKDSISMKKESLLNRIRKNTRSKIEEKELPQDEETSPMSKEEMCIPEGCLPQERPSGCSEEMYNSLVEKNYPFCSDNMEQNRINNMKIIDILQKLENLK